LILNVGAFWAIGVKMYDSKSSKQDISLMKIALENAKCRRDPNFVPHNLKEYTGFKDSAVEQALGRFGDKMKGIK